MKISIARRSKKFSDSVSTLSDAASCRENSFTPSNIKISSSLNQTQEPGKVNTSVAEYVRLSNSQVIVVTTDRVWVYRPNLVDSRSSLLQPPTSTTGSVATTKKLLDTAIILGKRDASKVQKAPDLCLTNWIWSLISQYHVANPTPRLMRKAAQSFKAQGRIELAEWSEEKAIEETGHERLALLDIQSLGYQAEALVQAFTPPSAKILVDYFSRSAQASDPISTVGYAYALERTSLAVKQRHAQAIEAIVPPGVNATRFLQVHSSIGSDVKHVDEALEMIARLSTAERNNVAIACYEAAKLYFTSRISDYPPVAELQQMLQPFKCQ